MTPATAPPHAPILREVATVPRTAWSAAARFAAGRLDPILRNEASRPLAATHDIHAVFQDLEDKDGHLFAVLQTRKHGVLARDRRLEPLDESPDAARAAATCRRALAEMPGLDRALHDALDALGKGLAVLEVMWRVAPDGAILPSRLVPRWPGRFALADDGTLRRHDPGDPADGVPMPPRKFLVVSFRAGIDAGPASGLCFRAYWYSWFKRNNLKAWALFNEKFGAPTVVARFPDGADDAERRRLLETIDAIQQDAGIILPEGIALSLLEAQRGGQVATYRDLADWCNDEISKIVLGQTLTTTEGRRSGSLALGRVHEAIRDEYVEADARLLEEAFSDQLLRWIVDFNLGTDVPAPRLRIDTTREERLAEEAEVDKLLLGMGVPLGVDYFYDRYRRPRPAPGDDVLTYDDRNLFQYHLRFGVLTVNEVRARMGYAPVAWGDRPVNEVEAFGAAPPAPPGGSRRDALGSDEDPPEGDPPEKERDDAEH